MGKFLNDWVAVVDSSAVAVLMGLSRVLFMPSNNFQARATTLVASICFGLAVGITIKDFEIGYAWKTLVIALASLTAKECTEFLTKKMQNPISFYRDITGGANDKKEDNGSSK
jgi:hypothetical protein